MKRMKKLAALFLAVVMVMAMGMTASAATPGKITIKNPIEGSEYKAYKIFEATTGNGHTAYTLDKTCGAYDLLKGLATTPDATSGVTIKATAAKVENETVYKVEVTNAPNFAAYLKKNVESLAGGISGSLANEEYAIDITEDGYYFIDTNLGTLALTNLNPVGVAEGIDIYDKNETPTIKKTTTVSDNNVEVGQVVPYTISGSVPSVVGYEKYNYKVSDTMSAGLRFNANSLNVTVGTTDLCTAGKKTEAGIALGKDFEVTVAGNTFTIVLNLVEKTTVDGVDEFSGRYDVDAPIVITYNATVLESAVTTVSTNDPLKNTATLEFNDDPSTDETDKAISEINLKSANIVVDKYAGNDTSQKLAGAVFALQNNNEGPNKGKYYSYADGKVTWVDTLDVATTKTTDANGAASFLGLLDGTYILIETEAPDGYTLMDAAGVEVTVDHNGTEAAIVAASKSIANLAGTVLPSTGGIGTTIFYVVGGILVLGAGVLLITKKRMSAK